jgi:hypothetical protein
MTCDKTFMNGKVVPARKARPESPEEWLYVFRTVTHQLKAIFSAGEASPADVNACGDTLMHVRISNYITFLM